MLNAGVGDADARAGEPAWVLLLELGPSVYAGRRSKDLLARPDRRDFARDLAAKRFSLAKAVDRYDRPYRELVSPGGAR